jgi:predicted CXXCH cytochrome family protein
MSLACSTCHDPHGSANHRNLRPNPSTRLLAGVTVIVRRVPTADPADAFEASAQIDKDGTTAWCNSCHGAVPDSRCRFNHPVDRAIWNAPNASYAKWSGSITNRVRVESPVDDVIPSTDDRVVCISCHKGHGSSEENALVSADLAIAGPLCEQCHTQP